jgi:hypothetical protein
VNYTWPPSSRADLTMLVSELEGLHQTQRLIHIPAPNIYCVNKKKQ